MSPLNPKRSRLPSTAPPSEPGVGDAPTMATLRGRSNLPMAARRRSSGSFIALVAPEARTEGFFVKELLQSLGAAVFRVEEAALMALGH